MFNLFKKKDFQYYAKRTVLAFRESSKYFVEADNHLSTGMKGIGPSLTSVEIANAHFTRAMAGMIDVQELGRSALMDNLTGYKDYCEAILTFMELQYDQVCRAPELKYHWDKMIKRCTVTDAYAQLKRDDYRRSAKM